METTTSNKELIQLFEENEKILVHHENNIYDAKVIKYEVRVVNKAEQKKKQFYYIHYLGWNEKWNEWVDANRILKLNEKNKELQTRVNSKHVDPTKKKFNMDDIEFDTEDEEENENDINDDHSVESSSSSTNTTKPITSLTSKRKRKLESTNTGGTNQGSSTNTFQPMDIIIPLTLKGALVDDWSFISNDKLLVKLPRSPNINEIFSECVKIYKKNSEFNETTEGLKSYFNKALGSILLYKFERLQYKEILKANPNKDLCEIYGAEHLLRLFVKLPKLLSTFSMEEDTINILKKDFDDILLYLEKNYDTLFLKQYISPTPVYLKQVNI